VVGARLGSLEPAQAKSVGVTVAVIFTTRSSKACSTFLPLLSHSLESHLNRTTEQILKISLPQLSAR